MERKVVIIIFVSAGVLIVGGAIAYPAIVRSGIRKRLDEAYNDPSGMNSVGGFNKLLVSEIFNPNTFKQSGKATISLTEARERAKQVWEGYSYLLSSDAVAIISAFSGLGHAHDVSKISNEFKSQYGYELLSVLESALPDKADYNILLGKISQLPKN